MNNKPIAYTGFFLEIVGFLIAVALIAFGESVAWLRNSGEPAAWGAFALIVVGFAFGLLNRKTAPGKFATYFGGVLIALFLFQLLSTGR